MRKVVLGLVLAVSVSVISVVMSAPSAQAGSASSPYATLTAPDGWIGTQMPDSEFHYYGGTSFQIDINDGFLAELANWKANVTVTGPAYSETRPVLGYPTLGSYTEEQPQLIFLDGNGRAGLPGTYTVRADVTYTYSDLSKPPVSESLTTTLQVVGPASSTLSLRKTKLGAHGWKIRSRALANGKPWASKKVLMQVKYCGKWHKVIAKRTKPSGWVTFTSNPKSNVNNVRYCGRRVADLPFRLYVEADERTWGAISKTFTIRYR
jgi:hypothetical protein